MPSVRDARSAARDAEHVSTNRPGCVPSLRDLARSRGSTRLLNKCIASRIDPASLNLRDANLAFDRVWVKVGDEHPHQAEDSERQERVVDPQAAVRIS
jgi:hypothetical protein